MHLFKSQPTKVVPISPPANEHHTTDSNDKNQHFESDFILVHTEEIPDFNQDVEPLSGIKDLTENNPLNPPYSASDKKEIRKTFELFLKQTYHLELEEEIQTESSHRCSTSVCCCRQRRIKKTTYVKIHAPFYVLLFQAEKSRMKLPIEEIEENKPTEEKYDRWNRFIRWIKGLFKDKLSLENYRPLYLTSVYSLAKMDQFIKFFDKRNRSKEEINSSSDTEVWTIAEQNYFTACERQWLIYELLSRVTNKKDKNEIVPTIDDKELWKSYRFFGIDQLISDGIYNTYYPLHENIEDKSTDRYKLRHSWVTLRRCLTPQPLDLIRSYMGEKVAFYFAVLGSYTLALTIPAAIGLIIFIFSIATVNTDNPTSDICNAYGQSTYMCPLCDKTCAFWKLSDSCTYAKISYVFDNIATFIFAIIMAIWARFFVEWWKRYQSKLQHKWDSIDFEEFNESIRPDFENKVQTEQENPRTHRLEPHVNRKTRLPKLLTSAAAILLMIIFVCLTIFAITIYRIQMAYALKDRFASSQSSIIITVTSALINLIISLILSKFYYWLARKLTQRELHKYHSKYEDAFSIKIYVFEFVNYYSSLFYIAFFKGRTIGYPSTYGAQSASDFNEQCDPAGCMVELSIQLIIIMLGKQIINTVMEYGWPYLTSRKICCRKYPEETRQWIMDNKLDEFDWEMLLPEYLEMTMQFGFVTLFVAAFPLAPLLALVNNIFELRFDAWKFLTRYRRPTLCKAADIGVWTHILSLVSYLAVFTNAAVIAWTSEFIPRLTYQITENPSKTLDNYINWTLSSFPIDDYNRTGTMNPNVPFNGTYCRYRDFRESTAPNYSHTLLYWHVIAARLAFMLIFENVIFLIVYLVQLLIPDVPSEVQENIDHQRYAEQRHQPAPPSDPSVVEKRIAAAKEGKPLSNNDQDEQDSMNTS